MYFPVGRLLQVSVEIQSSLALFERIFGYLDLRQEITDSPSRPAACRRSDVARGEITFDSVRVKLPEGARWPGGGAGPRGRPGPAMGAGRREL